MLTPAAGEEEEGLVTPTVTDREGNPLGESAGVKLTPVPEMLTTPPQQSDGVVAPVSGAADPASPEAAPAEAAPPPADGAAEPAPSPWRLNPRRNRRRKPQQGQANPPRGRADAVTSGERAGGDIRPFAMKVTISSLAESVVYLQRFPISSS
ncbi:hypothetical protein ACFSYD_14635 [Paracoccus aerius]